MCVSMFACVPDLNISNIFSFNCLPDIFNSYIISGSQDPYHFCEIKINVVLFF